MKRLVTLLLLLCAIAAVVEAGAGLKQCGSSAGLTPRPHSVTITEFGAVGDGVTLNTVSFQNAVFYLRSFADKGGAQLYVPEGRWLTGSFNLASHLTLFLEKDAVVIGTQDATQWPVVSNFPSYGGGGRHQSLINGNNVTDVVITGDGGAIDGQGSIWWRWFDDRSLNSSRPHLVEFVDSDEILISNLTFLNAPEWAIHPVYSRNVKIQNVTVRTPADAPFADGIVPDSCTGVCIQGCTVSVGHDAVALKSGIAPGMPISGVRIAGSDLRGSAGSGVAFGDEMSGGISDVLIKHLRIRDSSSAVSFRTTADRGGYIENVMITDVEIGNVTVAVMLTGDRSGSEHPEASALPEINRITMRNMSGTGISVAGILTGIAGHPFTDICLSNLNFSMTATDVSAPWSCSGISGYSESVVPEPCSDLRRPFSDSSACFSVINIRSTAAAS